MALFAHLFHFNENTKILDVGGSAFNWMMLPFHPDLTILDVFEHRDKAGWAQYVVGDGCATTFHDRQFDIVFSNSVIEHVGGLDRQRQFASECMRCGRAFFVQTPNRWFPVDTHTLLPFAHWLPQKLFRKFIRISPRFLFLRNEALNNYTVKAS
jgi:ubiquinone/menaquinone biosynthesis C-methylase UbiE